jgi:hypothetical protein
MLDIEQDPGESYDDLRQRARSAVEDGEADPGWFDATVATERCYDADAECQLLVGEVVPWCSVHDECMTNPPHEGVDRCWRRADDLAEQVTPKAGWWKR